MIVPCGLAGIRGDLRTWFRQARAERFGEKARVVLQSPALWALVLYRFGRWIRDPAVPRPRLLAKALWVVYRLLWPVSLWVTRVFVTVQSEVGAGVWIHSHDSVWVVTGARIGPGCRLFGGNTLGLGGRHPHRGVPTLGANVVLGPGAVLVGPITIADGAVIGANASGARDVEGPGGWAGAPPRAWPGAPEELIPDLNLRGAIP